MTQDFSWLFIKMVSGLVLVIGLAIVLIRFVLPKMGLMKVRKNAFKWVHLLDQFPLNAKASLQLVKMGGKYLVLGVSENSVHVMTELPKEEGERLEI